MAAAPTNLVTDNFPPVRAPDHARRSTHSWRGTRLKRDTSHAFERLFERCRARVPTLARPSCRTTSSVARRTMRSCRATRCTIAMPSSANSRCIRGRKHMPRDVPAFAGRASGHRHAHTLQRSCAHASPMYHCMQLLPPCEGTRRSVLQSVESSQHQSAPSSVPRITRNLSCCVRVEHAR